MQWEEPTSEHVATFGAPPPDYEPHSLHAGWFEQVHLW
jgi:hypothetical protein